MFARVISAQTMADRVDDALRIAREQLPATRGQPGYRGFYVLADRASGKPMTISLGDSAMTFTRSRQAPPGWGGDRGLHRNGSAARGHL